ncbi:hypothetical protein ACT7DA_11205 [Bacillus pacificus]
MRIAKLDETIKVIQATQKMLNEVENNQFIQEQIDKLFKRQKSFEVEKTMIELMITNLNKYIKGELGELGERTKDNLNSWKSPVQKYYRYLNPLPSNSVLKFESIDEKLWIRVKFEQNTIENTNTAKNVLSSGQLNVLAIAIFLAINESQNIHEIDFIGIDDPIQNMDDVNQFSICDVLSNLNKQLIFSTHDMNFLKLFLKRILIECRIFKYIDLRRLTWNKVK